MDKVGLRGNEVLIEKHFDTPERANAFKRAYKKSTYGEAKEKVFVQLLMLPVVSSAASTKKKPGRPKKA